MLRLLRLQEEFDLRSKAALSAHKIVSPADLYYPA